ncbi:MAG: hypothetical protein KatS3mg031_2738 [Chitinophagales bacterium]|nr:MAG: hypothetical protein KatS3mg031_2738 [Chitinophagales bacterium]
MKNGIFSWWCLLVSISSYGQIVTVRDSLTGKPLDLVVLVSENPYAFTTTNALGKADVSTFQDAQQIWIRRLGYQMRQISYADLINAGLELSLAPSGIKLRQIEISSSRWNLAGQRAPNKVALIEPDEVFFYHPQTSADMLGTTGEVFIQKSQQGGGSPMIRGFAANRLLYSVDGVRMNTAIFRSGNLQNVISLDPLAMERTEVLFGPGSVIYGSDAIGGVMVFHTLRPQLSLTENTLVAGNALMRFASANTELTGHFDVNVGWKRWAIRTSLSYNHFGDLRMGRYGPDDYLRTFYVQRHDSADVVISNDDPLVQKPTGYSQINLMQKLRFKPSDAWNMEYAFHYSTTTNYARYDRLIRTRDGLPRSAQWYYGPQVWMMNHLKIAHHGRNAAYDEAVFHLAYQRFEESRHDRDFNDIQLRHRMEKVDAYSVNLDFIKSIRKRHHLFYGVEVVVDAVHSSGRDEDITSG